MHNQISQLPIMPNTPSIGYTTLIEPYFVEALRMMIGRNVVLETVRGNLQGMVADVKPEHLVLRSYNDNTLFYVRLAQIVYIMPD